MIQTAMHRPEEPAREDEDRARERLVCEIGLKLLPLARRVVRDESDAEDVVQDACVQALRSVAAFEGRAQLSTWMHRIVVNAALTRLRSRRRRREDPFDEALAHAGARGEREDVTEDAWKRPADEILERAEARRLVRASLALLPEGHRRVLLLRDIEGLDTESAALRLGVSANAVKTRLHRARRALHRLLAPAFADPAAVPADARGFAPRIGMA